MKLFIATIVCLSLTSNCAMGQYLPLFNNVGYIDKAENIINHGTFDNFGSIVTSTKPNHSNGRTIPGGINTRNHIFGSAIVPDPSSETNGSIVNNLQRPQIVANIVDALNGKILGYIDNFGKVTKTGELNIADETINIENKNAAATAINSGSILPLEKGAAAAAAGSDDGILYNYGSFRNTGDFRNNGVIRNFGNMAT